MRPSNNLENTSNNLDFLRFAVLSLDPPLEQNQDQMFLTYQGSLDLYNHLGSYGNIMQFQISPTGENR